MTLVNLPHASFTVRRYFTVKEVRFHSAGVVEIVAAMPWHDVEVIANVTSRVRPSFVGSLAPR